MDDVLVGIDLHIAGRHVGLVERLANVSLRVGAALATVRRAHSCGDKHRDLAKPHPALRAWIQLANDGPIGRRMSRREGYARAEKAEVRPDAPPQSYRRNA